MAEIDIKLDGVRELRRGLKEVRDRFPDEMKSIHMDIAEPVADLARDRAPYVEGDLRDTIKAGATKTAGRVQMGSKDVEHAGPTHYGWRARGIDPQPFLVSAHEDLKDRNLETYRDRIQDLLDQIDFGLPN